MKLECFLYILMRDYLPTGVVERIVEEHVSKVHSDVSFSNEGLLIYAKEVSKRLEYDQGQREE